MEFHGYCWHGFQQTQASSSSKRLFSPLTTVEIRLALGRISLECLNPMWPSLNRSRPMRLRKPRLLLCLLLMHLSAFRGFHMCVCLSALHNEDPFQAGLF